MTSDTAFHVIRLVTTGTPFVAHLQLRRAEANLAMARHEFKALLDHRAIPVAPDPPLPRRRRGTPAPPAPPQQTPDWPTLIGQPYRTDTQVLDQLLTALHRL